MVTHRLNTTVRASAELRYRSAATFHQPGVAMRLHRLFSHNIPLLVLNFNDDSYRLAPEVCHDDLIPILGFTFTNGSFKIHAPDGAFQTALVTDEGKVAELVVFVMLIRSFTVGNQSTGNGFLRFLESRTLLFTFIGSC